LKIIQKYTWTPAESFS